MQQQQQQKQKRARKKDFDCSMCKSKSIDDKKTIYLRFFATFEREKKKKKRETL